MSRAKATSLLEDIADDGDLPENPFIHGKITTVDSTNGVYIAFEGDEDDNGASVETVSPLPILGSYYPTVNDRVLLASVKDTWVILGEVGNSLPELKQKGSFTSTFTTQNSTSGTLNFPIPFNVAPILTHSVIVGANLDVLLNWTGVPSINSVAWRLFQKGGVAISGTVTVHWVGYG